MLITVQILFYIFLSFLSFFLSFSLCLFAMQLLFGCMYITMHDDYVLCTRLDIKCCFVLFCMAWNNSADSYACTEQDAASVICVQNS